MQVEKSSVLVTGGTGAIGLWVTRNLVERGLHPVVYDVFPPGRYLSDVPEQITFIEGDVLDLDKLVSTVKTFAVRSIIHMAKLIPPGQPLVALKSNVLGSAHALEAARLNNVQRVVFTSSHSVYGHIEAINGELPVISEDYPKFDRTEKKPLPYYTITNKMVEDFGIRYAMDFGMEFVITRFGGTFGPGKLESRRRMSLLTGVALDETNVPRLSGNLASLMIDYAIAGKPFRFPEGRDNKSNLVYYKDIANGVVLAALSDKIEFQGNHREFHFDGGQAITFREVIAAIKKHLPEADIEMGPGWLTSVKHPDPQVLFDLSRAKKELGYFPQYDIEAAVADYIATERKFHSQTVSGTPETTGVN